MNNFAYQSRSGEILTGYVEEWEFAKKMHRLRSHTGSTTDFAHLLGATHRVRVGSDEMYVGTRAQCDQWVAIAVEGKWRDGDAAISDLVTV